MGSAERLWKLTCFRSFPSCSKNHMRVSVSQGWAEAASPWKVYHAGSTTSSPSTARTLSRPEGTCSWNWALDAGAGEESEDAGAQTCPPWQAQGWGGGAGRPAARKDLKTPAPGGRGSGTTCYREAGPGACFLQHQRPER